jgi:hypothetical protein
MPKAKATTPATEAPKFLDAYKAGTRHCQHCGKYTIGPKAPVCLNPACAKPFPPTQSKGNATPAAHPVNDFAYTVNLLKKVRAFITKYRQAETPLALVDNLEALVKDCGGFNGLREAIEVLPELADKVD